MVRYLAAVIGVGLVLGVIFLLPDSGSSSRQSSAIQVETTELPAGGTPVGLAAERRAQADNTPSPELEQVEGEDDLEQEPEGEAAPMEPLVGGYWEQYFEEHHYVWGPFPGLYDGYIFPETSDEIQHFIDDPLFNPRAIDLTPNQRAELQRIVSEARDEIQAARNSIYREYSQKAMALAPETGELMPFVDGSFVTPEPDRPGQRVTHVGIVTEEGVKTVAVRVNQGEHPSILDLQSKASQTKDYWIGQILAYFESL